MLIMKIKNRSGNKKTRGKSNSKCLTKLKTFMSDLKIKEKQQNLLLLWLYQEL